MCANYGNLSGEVNELEKGGIDSFHIDIMDGRYVPNYAMSLNDMRYIRYATNKPLDAHLMIVDPDRYLEQFCKLGVNWLTVHYEACTHLHRTLGQIRALGMKSGVAINPHTPVSVLADIVEMADLVLVMSVNPGFGGQRFIVRAIEKVRQLRQLIDERGCSTLIEVDGGVDASNAASLYEAGANVLVAGSAVFGAASPLQAIDSIKYAAR